MVHTRDLAGKSIHSVYRRRNASCDARAGIKYFTATRSERRLSPDEFPESSRAQEVPVNHDTADHLEWLGSAQPDNRCPRITSRPPTLYSSDKLSVSDYLRHVRRHWPSCALTQARLKTPMVSAKERKQPASYFGWTDDARRRGDITCISDRTGNAK